VHKAWIIVEAGSRDEAALVVPPAYRAAASIVQLTRFRIEDLGTILAQHNFDRKGA
jgi:hypothetical protein